MHHNPKQVTDLHQQSYPSSCATSLGELLIKLEGETPPDLQQHEAAGPSTGLKFLKDQTYGRLTIRQYQGAGPLSALLKAEIGAGRVIGIFLNNKFWNAAMPGIHAWAAVRLVDVAGKSYVHLLSKESECGQGQGKNTVETLVGLTDLDAAPVTDVVYYQLVPAAGAAVGP